MADSSFPVTISEPEKQTEKEKEKDELVSTHLEWSPSIDTMLANWCDQAKCQEWMHTEAYSKYDKINQCIILITHILTTISGLSNVMVGNINVLGIHLTSFFGTISILLSLIHIVQDKLGYSRLSTIHKQHSVTWGTIHRKIEAVIAVPIPSRKDCSTFVKYVRDEMNRVSMEGNVLIPSEIRSACYTKYSNVPNFVLPDICGEMSHTVTYTNLNESSLLKK